MREKPIITQDLSLAIALATYGFIPFVHDGDTVPFAKIRTAHGLTVTFFFEETNERGEYTQDFIDHWYDENWYIENSAHEFAGFIIAHHVKNALLDMIKQGVTVSVVQNGNRFCYISDNLPEDMKNKVLAKF